MELERCRLRRGAALVGWWWLWWQTGGAEWVLDRGVGVRARELLADLGSEDASVRHRATLVLGGCRPRDVQWVPDLIGGFRGGPSDVRFYAAVALGGIGRAAGEGAPALVEMLL